MKLKLDENLGRRGVELLRQARHDVATVVEQGLCAATDRALIDVCRKEQRCLITLDLDFANPLLFKPTDYPGIAVLRLPYSPTPKDLYETIKTLIAGLAREDITGKLWIVQRGRIRTYQPE